MQNRYFYVDDLADASSVHEWTANKAEIVEERRWDPIEIARLRSINSSSIEEELKANI